MRVCIALFLLLATLPAMVQGQSADAPEKAALSNDSILRRLAIDFDFNERERGNFTDMPLHWNRIGGDGFPGYTDIQFDEQVRRMDQGMSLRLALNGGNAAVELKSGVLAAIPETDYLLEGYVRTQDAKVARARVVGLYLDANNRVIERHQSTPMASPDHWAMFRLDLHRAPRDAAWIALRLELLQPDQYRPPEPKPLAPHALNPQDLNAKAWFDDLAVYRMPRIEITVQHASGLIRAPEQPALHLVAQDPLGESRQAQVRLWDHRGVEVAHDHRDLNSANRHPWVWKPDLSGYGYGWYRAELLLYSASGMRVRRSISFAWLPPMDRMAEADRFALIAEGLSPMAHDHIPDLLAPLSPQTLVIDAWRDSDTLESLVDASAAERNPTGQMLNQGQRVILSLGGIPTELGLEAGVDPGRPMDLFLREPTIWQPWLQTLLSRYGHRVGEWMMGSASGEVATDQQLLPTAYQNAHQFFRRYVTEPALILPWSAPHPLSAAAPANAFMMKMPASVQPSRIPGYAGAWSENPHVTLLLETGDPKQFSANDRATDLALRMLYAWRYGARRMALNHPWTTREDAEQPYLPDPLLPVWDNMALRLAGRRVVGELPLGNHLHAWILQGSDGGALALWSSSEGHQPADLYLGENPIAIDIWGNRSRVPLKDGKHHLQATMIPTLIEGVDTHLLMLRSAFALDNPFIPAQLTRHRRILRIHNPWPITITGQMRITGPESWRIQPGVNDLTIASGATLEIPLDMSFPLSETQGSKPLTARLTLEADRTHTVDLQAPMIIGLEHLEMRPRLIFEPHETGDDDLVVVAEITNTSDRAESLYVFAAAPGLPRQQRLVSPLGPGQTVIKRFRFPAAGRSLSGKDIRVGIRAIDGPALLNDVLNVP